MRLANNIKKEVYSRKNQQFFAFNQIKRKFNYSKKVEDLVRRCEGFFKIDKSLTASLKAIQKSAIARTLALKFVVHTQKKKLRSAFDKLGDCGRALGADLSEASSEAVDRKSVV